MITRCQNNHVYLQRNSVLNKLDYYDNGSNNWVNYAYSVQVGNSEERKLKDCT